MFMLLAHIENSPDRGGRVFPSCSYLSNCHETWPNFRLSSPTGVLPWTMTRREILIFRTIAFCPRPCKVYVVSGTPSQHPHGVSKSNEKVTFVPKKTHQHFSLLYNQNTNLSSKILKSCHTLFLLFEIPFLQNQISLSI